MIVYINEPHIKVPKYINHKLIVLSTEIKSTTIIVGDLATWLSTMDKSARQRINKETADLNILYQMDLREHYIWQQQNTHSSQVCMKHFLG